MDLVNRYVYAVKRHLPAHEQDDIVNELTDDILSQIRDREEELGRPLGDEEQEAVLKQYGHPYLLAMRYRPRQYLIGPALFPFYFPALKIAMALAFGVQVIVAFSIGLAQQTPARILPHILGFVPVAFQVAFWVTVVFAVADHFHAKLHLFDRWSPRTLPRVSGTARPAKRTGLVIDTVANVIGLAWWLAVPAYPFLLLGPAAAFLSFSPDASRIYYVALIAPIVSIVMALAIFARPGWTWLPRVRSLTVNLLTLFVVSIALDMRTLVVPAKNTPELVQLVQGINDVSMIVLIVIALAGMAQLIADIVHLVRLPSA